MTQSLDYITWMNEKLHQYIDKYTHRNIQPTVVMSLVPFKTQHIQVYLDTIQIYIHKYLQLYLFIYIYQLSYFYIYS